MTEQETRYIFGPTIMLLFHSEECNLIVHDFYTEECLHMFSSPAICGTYISYKPTQKLVKMNTNWFHKRSWKLHIYLSCSSLPCALSSIPCWPCCWSPPCSSKNKIKGNNTCVVNSLKADSSVRWTPQEGGPGWSRLKLTCFSVTMLLPKMRTPDSRPLLTLSIPRAPNGGKNLEFHFAKLSKTNSTTWKYCSIAFIWMATHYGCIPTTFIGPRFDSGSERVKQNTG